MTKITLDPTLQSKLNGFDQNLEVCDPAGQTVGYFVSAAQMERLLKAEAEKRALIRALGYALATDEELKKARASTSRTYTTEEVIRELGL